MRPPQVDERHFGNERSRLMPGSQKAVVGPTHDVARPRIRVGDIRFSRFVIDALDLSTYSRRTRADSLSTRPPRCTTSLARGRSANRHRRTGRSLVRRDRSWLPLPSPRPQSTVSEESGRLSTCPPGGTEGEARSSRRAGRRFLPQGSGISAPPLPCRASPPLRGRECRRAPPVQSPQS
jgi:hypothetical protein